MAQGFTEKARTTLPVGGGSLPVGGTTGQVLTKQSNTDGDADWETPAAGGEGTTTITYVTSTSTVQTSSPTLSWPTVANNDIAFFFHTMRNRTTTGPDGGTGWTMLFSHDTSSNEYNQVWYHVCDGTESGTITVSGGSSAGTAEQSLGLVVMRGVDTTSPVFSHTYNADSGDSTPINAALTDGYCLFWWLNAYNGTNPPSVTGNAYPLTTHLAVDDGTGDEQILVAGRASKISVVPPETATNIGVTGYVSCGVLSLRAA